MGLFDSLSGGSALSGGLSLASDFLNQDANRKAAHSAQDFSERMADTSYQRGMADMQAAGLNPLLVAKVGGDPTASGQMYQTDVSGQRAVQSAQTYQAQQNANQLLQEQLKNVAADTNLKQSQSAASEASANLSNTQSTKLAGVDTANVASQTTLNAKQLDQLTASINNLVSQAKLNQANATGINADNVAKQITAQLYADHPWLKQSDVVGNNSILQFVKSLLPSFRRGADTINVDKSNNVIYQRPNGTADYNPPNQR